MIATDDQAQQPLRLNLGCGSRKMAGYLNVDRFGNPDLHLDLEQLPWPWADNSVSEICLIHVLEHLGKTADIYLGIIQEMYRICQPEALVHIVVPHPRHENFLNDPTHVRAITPTGLRLFDQRLNREWSQKGLPFSTLGLHLGVDFEMLETQLKPSTFWYQRHPEKPIDEALFLRESLFFNNVVEEIAMTLKVVKPGRG
ncbi:class I SAM-dependent methyltransferase [Trichothermofontia sp.]